MTELEEVRFSVADAYVRRVAGPGTVQVLDDLVRKDRGRRARIVAFKPERTGRYVFGQSVSYLIALGGFGLVNHWSGVLARWIGLAIHWI